jgi:hypothetical protein
VVKLSICWENINIPKHTNKMEKVFFIETKIKNPQNSVDFKLIFFINLYQVFLKAPVLL